MSHKIERSFKLIFWGTELGEFKVQGQIGSSMYSVSTIASGKSLIRLLSKFEISSGAVGSINANGDFIPRQSITRWNMRGKFRQTQLRYQDGTLITFEGSPELTKDYHIDNPIGIENTIDPVSLVLWLLLERREHQLCKEKLKILDGFRMSELSFQKKSISQNLVTCSGKIKRRMGFKNSDLDKKPLEFKIIYSLKNSNDFEVTKVEIETIVGKITIQ